MPNWCANTLRVKGSPENLDSFLEEVKYTRIDVDTGEKVFMCFAFSGMLPQEGEEYERLGWIDWRIKYWGTTKEAFDPEIKREGNKIEITFDTAWSPPREWFKIMTAKYSKLDCTLAYCESGSAYYGFDHSKTGSPYITDQEFHKIKQTDYAEHVGNDEEYDSDYEPEPIGTFAAFLKKYGLQHKGG